MFSVNKIYQNSKKLHCYHVPKFDQFFQIEGHKNCCSDFSLLKHILVICDVYGISQSIIFAKSLFEILTVQ